jgi:hypothetical protein
MTVKWKLYNVAKSRARYAVGIPHHKRVRMNLQTIAKAYTGCIELEDRIQRETPALAEEVAILRSDLHALLMDALRQAHISFTDRAHAARIAYEIAQGKLKTRATHLKVSDRIARLTARFIDQYRDALTRLA